jgi:hypothetical protein
VRVTVERLPRTKSVRFRVEDNGPGLDAETLRHCFDPFFSSVSSASSTRLGLPLVRALVERAGGQISARSKLGEGTSFTVAIPAAERRLRRRRPSALARVARITVDDPATFESVTSIVRGSGFYVDETDALLAGSVQVWITDAQSPPEELLEFVEDSPNRLVVVVNAPAAGPQHSRIHRLADLDEEPGLREILTSFLPAPSPLPTGPATRIPFTPR